MFVRSLSVALFSLLLVSSAFAQSTLSGIVRDASGAVVPGTTIIVRRAGSSFERLVESGRDGRFDVASIADGEYTVEYIAPGFAIDHQTVTVPLDAPLSVSLNPAAVVEEVQVVSASRQDELRQSLNTNVSVVSRRQIEESGSQTVGELLREVPGVISRRGSETAGAAGQQIQGIDSRQVLVLLDGQPLLGARGIKRGVVNLDRQSSARLEQVEVVKGAASALYGSDAIGGVINMITRDATAPFDTTGELSGGSRGEVNAVAEAGVRGNRLSGLFSIEHHQNDGFDLTPTTFDTTGAPFERVDLMARARVKATDALSVSVLATGYETPALNRHPLIGAIVADRARSISVTPPQEAVIVVAHGPVPDEDNRRWLEDMAVLAEQTKKSAAYASVDYMTVRDDAGPAMREAATKELRDKVQAQIALGRRILIVPHLMSFGGIEQGIRKRLDGLEYTMTTQALMPDERIVQWVLASVEP